MDFKKELQWRLGKQTKVILQRLHPEFCRSRHVLSSRPVLYSGCQAQQAARVSSRSTGRMVSKFSGSNLHGDAALSSFSKRPLGKQTPRNTGSYLSMPSVPSHACIFFVLSTCCLSPCPPDHQLSLDRPFHKQGFLLESGENGCKEGISEKVCLVTMRSRFRV